MRIYRLYSLDQSGHIFQAQELAARDDSDACAQANEVTRNRWELWDRGRLVARSDDYQRRHG
jgi:hypothetical protein